MSTEIDKKVDERTIDEDEKKTMKRTIEENIETAWDRLEAQQPQCGFGQLGICFDILPARSLTLTNEDS